MKTLFLFLLLGLIPHAQAADCEFFAREKVPQLFTKMPPEVRGMVNCYPYNQDANIFIVSKLENMTEASFETYVQNFAQMIDLGSKSTMIEWKSKQPLAHRQALVKTSSEKSAMEHYAFVSRGLVFVHSMDQRDSLRIRKSLDHLYLKINGMNL